MVDRHRRLRLRERGRLTADVSSVSAANGGRLAGESQSDRAAHNLNEPRSNAGNCPVAAAVEKARRFVENRQGPGNNSQDGSGISYEATVQGTYMFPRSICREYMAEIRRGKQFVEAHRVRIVRGLLWTVEGGTERERLTARETIRFFHERGLLDSDQAYDPGQKAPVIP